MKIVVGEAKKEPNFGRSGGGWFGWERSGSGPWCWNATIRAQHNKCTGQFGKKCLGQTWCWPKFVWPKLVWPKLAITSSGRHQLWPNQVWQGRLLGFIREEGVNPSLSNLILKTDTPHMSFFSCTSHAVMMCTHTPRLKMSQGSCVCMRASPHTRKTLTGVLPETGRKWFLCMML